MSLAHKIGSIIPEGRAKNAVRTVAFRGLFATTGTRDVLLGPSGWKIPARIARLLFSTESLGEREIEGYLHRYRPQSGDVVVNAGAYHGYFALYLSHLVGATGRVICFEPEINNYHLLQKNLALNIISNVTVIRKGLWHSDGQLPITTQGSGSTLMSRGWTGQTVPVCRLDRELIRLGIDQVNFITMDIEGAEIDALAGCQDIIAHNPDVKFAIASYHQVNGSPTWPTLEKIFSRSGFQAETSFPRHLTTYAQKNF